MIVTVLAIAFLIIIGFISYFGYKTIIQKAPTAEEQLMETCAICRKKFEKHDLLLREIGDYKVLYFCRECIMKLYADIGLNN